MPRQSKLVWFLSGLVSLSTALAFADEPIRQEKGKSAKEPVVPNYVRLTRDEKKKEPLALETAVVQFAPELSKPGPTVDLVAAVHVGDKSYYKALNKLFKDYDVVLYELVAEPGTRVPRGGKKEMGSMLSFGPMLMKSLLDLESQTEQIDYTKPNFVHADLSFEGMRAKMEERGENGWTLALSVLSDLIRQSNLQAKKPDSPAAKAAESFDLTTLFSNDPDAPLHRKRLMATQLADPDALGAGLGQALNTLLINDRNQAAMKVLRTEMGKGHKKIAIFYGAAHMPDFERRLKDELQMARKDEKWITAWDLE